MIFPWFAMARNWISVFSHVMFGLVAGWMYLALRRPALVREAASTRATRGWDGGMTLDEVREVLAVAVGGTAPCEHVQATLSRRLREIETRVAELSELHHSRSRASSEPATACRVVVRMRDHRVSRDAAP
jgi:hypothetical protein